MNAALIIAGFVGAGGLIGAVIGIAGAVIGVTAVMYSRRQARTGGLALVQAARDDARDEALQLAEVRRQTIVDLNARVDGFREEIVRMEKRHGEQVLAMEEQIEGLKRTMQEVREEAAEAQRTIAVSVRLSLRSVRGYLELEPPDVTAALHDLRDMLDGDSPAAPRSQT